jgi:tetratricopeptide (TPR) repeat protein
VRVVAVLPFVADGIDPDANDLARWLTMDAAGELSVPLVVEARRVLDVVEISAGALGEAAAQLSAELALGATLRIEGDQLELAALLVAASGEVKAQWGESLPLGRAPQLGRMLARAVLLALGEDASAPPERVEGEVPGEAVLRLVRAARRIEEDAGEAAAELVALCGELPQLEAARRTLLGAARAALDSEQMPSFFSALERLAEACPDDPEVLLALGDYRVAHLDEPGARELYLAAREIADDPALTAQACASLAALAEAAGRNDEAVLHLRAAVKNADQPDFYARLAALLLPKDPAEGLQMLARATVLAPDDAELHLSLSRAIREHGGDRGRALSAAARAAELCPAQSELADRIREELELLLTEP